MGRTDSGAAVNESGADTAAATHSCSRDKSVCIGLCPGVTTLSGKVFDPAGKNPVYDAAVWVPSETPGPMPPPLSCNCASLYMGGVVGAYAITAPDGSFRIDGVASAVHGTSVPLVVQLGKWRYQTHVDVVCGQANSVPDGALRLPQGGPGMGLEFAGDLPQIAVSTGGADTLECLLARMGVAEQEYAPGSGGPQHVHIFQGSPADVAPNTPTAAPPSASTLWDSADHLSQFDAVLLSCEGAPTTKTNPQALYAYGLMGGRVFASHDHYTWFLDAPFSPVGTWFTEKPNRLATAYGAIATTLPSGGPFPEGKAMMQWLQAAGALDSSNEFPIADAYHTLDALSSTPTPAWIPWIDYDAARSSLDPALPGDPLDSASTLFLSYGPQSPISVETTCGRFIYSDLHSANPNDYGPTSTTPPDRVAVPAGCAASDPLSSQEKVLEFTLLDLLSCTPPLAPPAIP